MSNQRNHLAARICSGLAGWHQLQFAQNLGLHPGEDSARNVIAQIVNAQGRFAPATSQLPPNWKDTKLRIDVALLGRSKGAATWYGVIEVKWPGASFDTDQQRTLIVQDAVRVSFVKTSLMNAKFVLLGGAMKSLQRLFDDPHPRAKESEARRTVFCKLFSRDVGDPRRALDYSEWYTAFPNAGERVPTAAISSFQGKLETELVAMAVSKLDGQDIGHVYAWQCSRRRGPATKKLMGISSDQSGV